MMFAHSPALTLSAMMLLFVWMVGEAYAVIIGIYGVWAACGKQVRARRPLRIGIFPLVFGAGSIAWFYWQWQWVFDVWWLYLMAAFPLALGFVTLATSLLRTRKAERGAPPKGGPATPPGNPGVTEEPPSVS